MAKKKSRKKSPRKVVGKKVPLIKEEAPVIQPMGSTVPAIDLGKPFVDIPEKVEKVATTPRKSENTRRVTNSGFEYIERVWAADGVVKVETKEGKLVNMTVRDAAVRAGQINAMPLPKWHVERRNELVRQIVAACREAKHQMESPMDSKAAAMSNLLNGLTPDGRSLDQLKKAFPVIVQKAMALQPAFVHMEIEEIVSVLRNPQLSEGAKKRVLAEEDWGRSQAKVAAELDV